MFAIMSKKIPSAKGLPVLGSLLKLINNQPYKYFVDTYKELGPVYNITLPGHTLTILGGPEANLFLSNGGMSSLSNRDFFADMEKEFKPGLIIALDGEAHRRSRKVIEFFLNPDQVSKYVEPMIKATLEHMKEWQLGQQLEVTNLMRELICKQTTLALLRVSPNDEQFNNITNFFDTVVRSTATIYKSIFKWFLHTPSYLKSKREVFSFIQEIVDERRNKSTSENPDMLDTLLTMTHDDGTPLTEDEIFLFTIAPFLVGIDTSANTASFLMYEILKDKVLHQRIMVEVNTAFSKGIPDLEKIRKMKALRFAVMETLRMYPVGFMLARYVKHEFEFSGYKIQKDKNIYIAPGISHFLPKFFPDPYKFDIERYDSPRQEHKQPGAYVPFSIGPHSCAGSRLAEVQIMITVGTILYAAQPQLDPPDYCMKTTLISRKSAMLSAKEDFYMKVAHKNSFCLQ